MYMTHDSRLRSYRSRPPPQRRILKTPLHSSPYVIELRNRIESFLEQFEKAGMNCYPEESPELPVLLAQPPNQIRMFPGKDGLIQTDSDDESLLSDSDGESIISHSAKSFHSCSASYCPSHQADSRWADSEDLDSMSSYGYGYEGESLADKRSTCTENLSENDEPKEEMDNASSTPSKEICSELLETDSVDRRNEAWQCQLEKSETHDDDCDLDVEFQKPVKRLTSETLAQHEAEEAKVGRNRLSRLLMSLKLDEENPYNGWNGRIYHPMWLKLGEEAPYNDWSGSIYHPMWLGNASMLGQKRGKPEESESPSFSAETCPFLKSQHLDIEDPQAMVPISERKIANLKRVSYALQRKWSKEHLCNGGSQWSPTSAAEFPLQSDIQNQVGSCYGQSSADDEALPLEASRADCKRSRVK